MNRPARHFSVVDAPAVKPKPIPAQPLQLTKVPFGKPDRELARVLCWHIADATPAIVIPFNPFTHSRVRAVLRSCGITL